MASQAPTLFLGQMAAIAFITGWEKGQPVAVDKLINDAKLTMKARCRAAPHLDGPCERG